MLNKGSRHGIANNMGVIGPKGVVGIVNSLSKDYCTVIPIISISSKISSKIKNNNELGTLIWDGQDHKTAQLINIESLHRNQCWRFCSYEWIFLHLS
jgi:rod shape-determining protein MreC